MANVTARIQFTVSVDPDAEGVHDNTAIVSGGGAENSDVDPIVIGDGVGKFGLIPSSVEGDTYSVERPDIAIEHQAGSHPFEQRVDFDLNQMYGESPTDRNPGDPYTKSIGRVRTVRAILPRGMIGNAEGLPKCRGNGPPRRGLRILPDSRLPGRHPGRLPEGTALERVLRRRLGLPQRSPPGRGLQPRAAERRRGRFRLQGRADLHRAHLHHARPGPRLRTQIDRALHHRPRGRARRAADSLGRSRATRRTIATEHSSRPSSRMEKSTKRRPSAPASKARTGRSSTCPWTAGLTTARSC